MKKRELLEEQLAMLQHNLMCYSDNLNLDKPKEGFETKWQEAQTKCELMKELLNQLPHWNTKEFTFIGMVSSWSVGFSKVNDEDFIKSLIVHDRDDNARMFEMEYEAGKKLLRTYDQERHRRYDINKDTNIIFTASDAFQSIKSWEWLVK